MALKTRYRSQLSKRCVDVLTTLQSKSMESNSSTSSLESDSQNFTPKKNKVRRTFRTKKLLKDNECFTVDGDHMYTITRSPASNGDSVQKRKNLEKGEKETHEKPSKKRCFSKNAVMARKNRERKKLYVSSLESENKFYLKENSEIKQKLADQNLKIKNMKLEILYLKGLLANSKELGQILRNLREVSGLQVTSSIIQSGDQCENSDKGEDFEDNSLYQPRTKTVTSGYNFPVLNNDINLGSYWNSSDVADLENSLCISEKDSYDNTSAFHFNSDQLNLEDSYNFEEVLKESEVGVCLHVNKRQVSVEICSICNRRATLSSSKPPDDIF